MDVLDMLEAVGEALCPACMKLIQDLISPKPEPDVETIDPSLLQKAVDNQVDADLKKKFGG